MREAATEILIVGGGLGGIAAALSAMRLGRKVIMTEETDWIGGQLTSQAVPPDENPWIEAQGSGTRTYQFFRDAVRDYYRKYYPLTQVAREDSRINPGVAGVSRLCHEPRVALAVLEGMLAPYRSGGMIDILLEHRPIAAETNGDRVVSVTLEPINGGEQIVISAPYIIDATELGDLLELAQVEHVIGAESQAQTGELHALEGDADPLEQQAITWCFAMDYLEGEDHIIDKPEDYDFWRTYQPDFWPGPHLGWDDIDPVTLQSRHREIFAPANLRNVESFWEYRRIFYKDHYPEGLFRSDITLVNWPQIDYYEGPLLGVSEEERQKHLRGAKQLSRSMLYWMQTEAPRHDGGTGYPGLRLRKDVVDTDDGLAKYVYIREARRIKAEFTVLEEHVGAEQRGDRVGAETFYDTVGIGSYRIDLHFSTAKRNYIDVSSYPFQIPLGALLPVRMDNLLPANKNIGTTHITNGCYRLHPVEWNIGESVGALAAYCLNNNLMPRQVRSDHLEDFQSLLQDQLGIPLSWQRFAAIHAR